MSLLKTRLMTYCVAGILMFGAWVPSTYAMGHEDGGLGDLLGDGIKDELMDIARDMIKLLKQKLQGELSGMKSENEDFLRNPEKRAMVMRALEQLGEEDTEHLALLEKLRNAEPLTDSEHLALKLLSQYVDESGLDEDKLERDKEALEMAADLVKLMN